MSSSQGKKLNRQLQQLAQQVGGSFKTVHDRRRILESFCRHLQQLNIQIRDLHYLKVRHIESYIQYRLEQGVQARTLQNEMAALRRTFSLAGRDKLVASPRLANSVLGLGGASRAGTRQAIPANYLQTVLDSARQRDSGLTATLQLARVMGLRSQEAVQAAQSLPTWQKALAAGATHLTVVFGTKGGRPRESIVLDRQAVMQAVKEALNITMQRNGRLIDKPNLKSAMNYWRSQTSRIGLTGVYSPHSLRYAWAQEAMAYYQQQGFSRKEALALTSMSLGHGDGRGRYIAQVYGKKEVAE